MDDRVKGIFAREEQWVDGTDFSSVQKVVQKPHFVLRNRFSFIFPSIDFIVLFFTMSFSNTILTKRFLTGIAMLLIGALFTGGVFGGLRKEGTVVASTTAQLRWVEGGVFCISTDMVNDVADADTKILSLANFQDEVHHLRGNADGKRELEEEHSNDADDHSDDHSENIDNNGQHDDDEFEGTDNDDDKDGITNYHREYHNETNDELEDSYGNGKDEDEDAATNEPKNNDDGGYSRKPTWWPFAIVTVVTGICYKCAPDIECKKCIAVLFVWGVAVAVTAIICPPLWTVVELSILLASFVFGKKEIVVCQRTIKILEQFKIATAVLVILVMGPLAMYGWDERGEKGTPYDFFQWWANDPAFHYLGSVATLTGSLYGIAFFVASSNVFANPGDYTAVGDAVDAVGDAVDAVGDVEVVGGQRGAQES